MIKKVIVTCTLFLSIGTSLAVAHPYDEYIPNPLSESYGTDDYRTCSVDRINDLTFNSRYPAPNTLTPEEIYIIAGATSLDGEIALGPWINEVGNFLSMFCGNEGFLPKQISEDMLNIWYADSGPVDSWFYDLYKNPMTNQYPRLDAEQFSPGDLYVRLLTEEEKRIFADGKPNLQSVWFEGRINRPGSDNDGAEAFPSPALYVRAYGWNDVIYEMVVCHWAVREPAGSNSGFGG